MNEVTIQRILVTTDLSRPSCAAFPYARELAGRFGASLVLAAVVEDPAELALFTVMENPGFFAADYQQEVLGRVTEGVQALAAQHFSGLSVETVAEESRGPVHDAIIRLSKEKHCQLIVMATRGHTGFMHFVLGSVSEKVARESAVPVLLVPAKDETAGSGQ